MTARPTPATTAHARHERALTEVAITIWATGGVAVLLATSAMRMLLRGWATLQYGLTGTEWVVLGLAAIMFIYGEGVVAMQRRWVPRVAARAHRLPEEPSLWLRLAGPLYAMGLVAPPGTTVRRAWAGVAAIVLAVVAVRYVGEPWRAIIDVSVAGALAWGSVSTVRTLVARE